MTTTPITPLTLRLAAGALDSFRDQRFHTLTPGESTELLELSTLLRAVARREGDLLLSAQPPDQTSPGPRPPGTAPGVDVPRPPATSYDGDPDGGLARVAAEEWTFARANEQIDAWHYAQGMEPFARGGGNLS